ncbi:MAG: hypothetical protein EXR84_13845 [Gammaproteobacteria bacterium]|nr:hypothetical protein [Gammaproteobacteria bacterium]
MFCSGANGQDVDPASGFIAAPGWQLVQSTCTTCHSSQIIVQNSGSREVWQSRIVWMQETQGLQQLAADVETTILDYLAANYGQKAATRRAGLAPHLLPTNPYDI